MQLLSRRAISAFGFASVVTFMFVGGTVAAEQANKSSIIGKWDFDSDEMLKVMEKQVTGGAIPEEQLAFIKGMIRSMKTTFEFKGDGTMSLMTSTGFGPPQNKQGTWSFVSAKDNNLTVSIKVDEKSDEMTITVVSKDAIALHLPKGIQGPGGIDRVPLKRAKE